jgi:hypothetical protein
MGPGEFILSVGFAPTRQTFKQDKVIVIFSVARLLAPSIVLVAAATWLSEPALSECVKYKADLQARSEVPPTDTSGSGSADITVDTEAKKVSWTVTSSGLSGDPTAAHFHGPAREGENAGPVIDFTTNLNEGSADLTDEQMQQLESGQIDINVHTVRFPDGKVRGQVMKAQ